MLLVLLVIFSQFDAGQAQDVEENVITHEYSHSSSSHECSHSSSSHETHVENVQEFTDGNIHTGETVNLMSFANLPPKIHYDISHESIHFKPEITYVKPEITYHVNKEPNVVVQPININYRVKPVDINVDLTIKDERESEFDDSFHRHHKEKPCGRKHGKCSSSSLGRSTQDRQHTKQGCHRCHPAPFCKDCKLTRRQVDDILDIVNDRRSLLLRHRQPNGHEGLLPQAKIMPKLSWCCGLEKQALRANIRHCPSASPRAPRGNALVYDADYDNNYKISDVLRKILSSIDSESLSDIHGTSVRYSGEVDLKAYANLMRCDATKIGCAWVKCSGEGGDDKYALYCLLNKGNIRKGDRIYDTRGPACRCRHCDRSGKCIQPPTPRTEAPPTPTLPPRQGTEAKFYKEGPNTICSWHDYMGDTMRMHMQDTHNFRRHVLALGKGKVKDSKGWSYPAATNMNYLNWDCQLEEDAYNYVKDCPTQGSGAPNENFLRRRITAHEPTYRDINKLSVTTWWKVHRKHNGLGAKVIFRGNPPLSSFTRMGWAQATKIGCVIAKCGDDFVQSCRYGPKVNQVNQQMYIPGKVCSKCDSLGQGPCVPALGLCAKRG
ncbi:unnamed protein product [Cylicocyclus nassatus]|uniref:SCP domain-containing protein n=1 Tax=Cylicocyclus nassatus TaxID=53992 RepID=A0AA36GZX7_CYLNA|nr:unnamed protein product [Cylicocyclus nassatus]